MKPSFPLLAVFGMAVLLTGCHGKKERSAPQPVVVMATAQDMPILHPRIGDWWKYSLRSEIPAGVTGPGAAAVDVMTERKRKYIGAVRPGAGLPESACFEVMAEGRPTLREFVEISDDKISLRGEMEKDRPDRKPLWFDPPILFVRAGLSGGEELPAMRITDPRSGAVVLRNLRVIGREVVTVPMGNFEALRLVMTGSDGKLEMRRTIWFAPHIGIVKEECARYADRRLVLRETQLLKERGTEDM